MAKKIKRIPKNYDGNLPTGRTINQLLPSVLEGISDGAHCKKELVEKTFFELVGGKYSPMIKVTGFADKVLFVSVKNSSLYSILKCQQKEVLLKKLQMKLPALEIQNIVFRLGV